MRKLLISFATAGVFGAAALSPAAAAPVPGFEVQYNAVVAACSPPAGTPADCELAINAYSAALVAAGVEPSVALASFTELRTEVAELGGTQFDALFEELLPESGDIGDAPSATTP